VWQIRIVELAHEVVVSVLDQIEAADGALARPDQRIGSTVGCRQLAQIEELFAPLNVNT
jgi:hypothetical protein